MRTCLGLVALVLAAACGGPEELGAAARDRLDAATGVAEDARAEARAAADRVADLSESFEELQADVDRGRKIAARVAELRERLQASIRDLRSGLADVRSTAGAGAASAEDALARASQVARDLAVLEERYDYHLRRYHGGG